MNIVYALENLSKTSYPRIYIGSKKECQLISLDGRQVILSNKANKIYEGSSSSPIMKEDRISGHIFTAHLLEKVNVPEEVRIREQEWLEQLDAANSEKFYNLTNNTLHSYKSNPYKIVNEIGEDLKTLAKSRSSISKRNLTAKKLGFVHCYDLYLYVAGARKSGCSFYEICRTLGCERHLASRWYNNDALFKILKEEPFRYKKEIELMAFKNYSHEVIGEFLGLHVASVDKVVQEIDFENLSQQARTGRRIEEIGLEVAKCLLNGGDFSSASDNISVDYRTAQKYFIKFFQKRFKISDLE